MRWLRPKEAMWSIVLIRSGEGENGRKSYMTITWSAKSPEENGEEEEEEEGAGGGRFYGHNCCL